MIDAADEDLNHEKRQEVRARALLGARLAYGEGYFTIDCFVRDMSESGARVKLSGGQAVPSVLYFLELRSGVVHQAKVVWRRHPEVGLQFTQLCSLDDPENPDLRVLKRLWTESQQRASVTS